MADDDPPQADLMRALGRLVRGLSALFWALPLTLVVSVQTARTNLLAPFGVLPPLLTGAFLVYALLHLGQFQPHERVWHHALDRVRIAAFIHLGLAPFLYWYKRMPELLHFQFAVLLLALNGWMLLFTLNQALRRLAAMLPDETLRLESRLFTSLNLGLLGATLLLATLWTLARHLPLDPLSPWLFPFWLVASHAGLLLLLLLVLLPLALTMALIWKTKETILNSVFRLE